MVAKIQRIDGEGQEIKIGFPTALADKRGQAGRVYATQRLPLNET
jgi:hypothetical protein